MDRDSAGRRGKPGHMMEDGVDRPDLAAEAEGRFRIMADSAPVMIWTSGTDKLCGWCNARWLRFTGRELRQELGLGWAESLHPEDHDRCLRTYDAAFEARRDFSMEYRLRRSDGEYRWVLDNGTPRYDPDGRFAGYIGSCTEVHEHRQREEELRELVRDRERLLREAHHRVKNNFQVIMSLISLRARALRDPQEQMRQRELLERIGVLAAAQEQLAARPRASRIDFGQHLRRIVQSLRELHGESVEVAEAIEPLEIPVDQAISLGLAATEALSNAYRHAFPDGRADARLRVTLRRDGGDGLELSISDNGTGLGGPPPARSIGLQIMRSLAMQAEAEVEMQSSAAGTTVTLRSAPPRDA